MAWGSILLRSSDAVFARILAAWGGGHAAQGGARPPWIRAGTAALIYFLSCMLLVVVVLAAEEAHADHYMRALQRFAFWPCWCLPACQLFWAAVSTQSAKHCHRPLAYLPAFRRRRPLDTFPNANQIPNVQAIANILDAYSRVGCSSPDVVDQLIAKVGRVM